MQKTLVIIAHPNLKSSSINLQWKQAIESFEDKVQIHELYKIYPDGKINVPKEQALLEQYEKIVFQFPLYWYSYPPLLKQWFDDVFTYNWAYGSKGTKLKNKVFGVVISAGDIKDNYHIDGEVGITIDEILSPLKATARKVGAKLINHFVLFGVSYNLTNEQFKESCKKYIRYILDLAELNN